MPWDKWRLYRLVKLGLSPSEIDRMSRVDTEWLLRLDAEFGGSSGG